MGGGANTQRGRKKFESLINGGVKFNKGSEFEKRLTITINFAFKLDLNSANKEI